MEHLVLVVRLNVHINLLKRDVSLRRHIFYNASILVGQHHLLLLEDAMFGCKPHVNLFIVIWYFVRLHCK